MQRSHREGTRVWRAAGRGGSPTGAWTGGGGWAGGLTSRGPLPRDVETDLYWPLPSAPSHLHGCACPCAAVSTCPQGACACPCPWACVRAPRSGPRHTCVISVCVCEHACVWSPVCVRTCWGLCRVSAVPSGGTASPAVASPQLHKHVPAPPRAGRSGLWPCGWRKAEGGVGGLSSCPPGPLHSQRARPHVLCVVRGVGGRVWGLSRPHSRIWPGAWSLRSHRGQGSCCSSLSQSVGGQTGGAGGQGPGSASGPQNPCPSSALTPLQGRPGLPAAAIPASSLQMPSSEWHLVPARAGVREWGTQKPEMQPR